MPEPFPILGAMGPPRTPARLPLDPKTPQSVAGFTPAPIAGVMISVGTGALTDHPNWVRIDGPGTI